MVDEGHPAAGRRPLVGLPPRPGPPTADDGVPAVWVDGGAGLAITTWGSSSAPSVPIDVVVDAGRLTVTLGARHGGAGVASLDLAAYVTVIETPAGLDPHNRRVLRIHGRDHDLPPVG